MLSVKLITPKRIKGLEEKLKRVIPSGSCAAFRSHVHRISRNNVLLRLFIICSLLLTAGELLLAQDNSPYSRYGLGDLHSGSNILNRGMGGISAGYSGNNSVNFLNPASYSAFMFDKKTNSGRVLLDVGINLDNRTLREANNPEKFNSVNTYFSYLQMGIPLRKNWGLSFGLRPVSKISYKIEKRERLYDPVTGFPIDSAGTEFIGDGGASLVSLGTGFSVRNFSLGFNLGYLFGKKDYSTRRTLINDSVAYNRSNHQTKASFGDIFLNAGMQYKFDLNSARTKYLQLGVFGNLKHDLNARRDVIRETFTRSIDQGDFKLDSVFEQLDVKGKIVYPASFGGGFIFEKFPSNGVGGWLIGGDFVWNGWDDYKFYGQVDSVRSNWHAKLGGQIRPAPKRNYFSNVAYRAGVMIGNDYVKVKKELPELGFSFGLGLPIANYNRQSQGQFATINLAFEYLKRGNNDNLLKEDMFRLSVGLSLSDFWFTKRKYD